MYICIYTIYIHIYISSYLSVYIYIYYIYRESDSRRSAIQALAGCFERKFPRD